MTRAKQRQKHHRDMAAHYAVVDMHMAAGYVGCTPCPYNVKSILHMTNSPKNRSAWPGLLLALLLPVLWGCGPRPQETPFEGKIEINLEPEQYPAADVPEFMFQPGSTRYMINPRAEYYLSGVVLGKKRYRFDRGAELAPYDLAIAWHKLVSTDLYKQISWSQSGRWYFWKYGEEFPFDNAFISRYSSNNHVIPANPNIRAALGLVRKGGIIDLSGYLVNVRQAEGEEFTWNSSLSREDEGGGSCEVFYVTEIRYKGMSYK